MSLLPHQIDRRQFLLAAGGLAIAAHAPCASYASSQPFLNSETGTLRRALIYPAVSADHAGMLDRTNPFWQETVDDVIAQHADMVRQLQSSGTKVLRLGDVLETAIDAAKRQGAWRENASAASLLARESSGAMHDLCYVRDFAVMLPRGLILCNVADRRRLRQSALFRFMVAFAPVFQKYPVLFDAAAGSLHAEGGDFQILDEHTLLVGVGNHTDARIAAKLARHTHMDVVAVNICNADAAKWNLDHDPLRDFLFHLNTSVAQITPGHVLVLPWLFEAEHTGPSVLTRADPLITEFGRLTRYSATDGNADPSIEGMKLVDYLRQRGFKVSYIGGAPRHDLEHWLANAAHKGVIFPWRERQAANILATAPGALLAFNGAESTHASLRSEGVRVSLVAGPAIWRGYGGPHCLTLPLERT